MSTHEDKTPANKSQSVSAENSSAETDENLFEYEDNRSVAVAQRKLQERADNSPKTGQTVELQSIANKQFDLPHPIQRKLKKAAPGDNPDNTIQLQEDLDELSQESGKIQEIDALQKEREKDAVLYDEGGKESDKQIEIEGKLTTTAKIKGFFGFNSTWDKFTNGVQKFNDSNDIAEKQKLLLELKPLAREWLKRHDVTKKEGGDVDENDVLKQKTIYKFLNQTSSNYEQIKNIYNQTNAEIIKLNSEITSQIVLNVFDYYKAFKNEYDVFFRDYTADINLLFINEKEEINQFKTNLESSALNISSPNTFDTGMGIEILSPQLEIRLNGTATVSGGVSWSVGKFTNVSGFASADFDQSGYIENSISITNGSAHTNIFGVDFTVSGLEYNSNILSAEKLEGQMKIFNKNITLTGTGVSIVSGNLTYESILASCEGDLKISNGIIITNPQGEYLSNGSLVLNGGFSIDLPNVANASGDVECSIKDRTIESISIKEGTASGDILGVNFNLNQISYEEQLLSIASATGELSIFGSSFSMKAEGLNFDHEKNIDFTSISGKMPGVDVGFFSTEETTLNFNKQNNLYSGTTEYTFRNDQISSNFNNFKTQGNILIEWIPGKKPHLRIEDGSIKFVAFGQSVDASRIIYDSENPLAFSAGEIELDSDIQGYNPKFTSSNVLIDQTGMHFSELIAEPNITPPALGPFTVKPKKLLLHQEEEKGYTLTVDGQIESNFPNQFGSVTGLLEGGVTFSTFSSNMDYFIRKGEAEMVAPNPLSQIADLLGRGWSGSRFEINANIPIFPGVFGVFGIFLAFNASFSDITGNVTIDEENHILINLESGISGRIDGGVFGGIQAGSQLLAALAILLEMAASSEATLNLGYRKYFGMDEGLEGSDIDPQENKEGFTYNLNGETKGSIKLSAVATALYFFQKRFELELSEASLGEFSFSNEGNKTPNPEDQEFFNDEDLKSNISDDVSEDAKTEISKMNARQMLDIDVNRRFESGEKKDTLNIFKRSEVERTSLRAEMSDDENSFNEVPFTNLVFFNEFINNRIDWDHLIDWYSSLSLEKCDQLMETEEGKQELRTIIEQMGEENNIASSFISFYAQKIKEVKTVISGYSSDDNGYIELLESKKELFEAAEKFKKDHLHSSFWGDDVRQGKNIRESRSVAQVLTFRNSGYENFKIGLSNLYSAMSNDPRVIPIEANRRRIQKKGSDYLLKLRQEHRDRNDKSKTTS